MIQNRRRNVLILVILAAPLFGIAFYLWFGRKAEPKVTYHEVPVEKRVFVESIVATGTVSPENRLVIKSPVAGRIEKILVREGQKVWKGQILAWISTTERAALLDSARAESPEELSQWEKFYKPTPIYAPINGMIILRSFEPGQSFNASDGILVMSDRLTIKAQVDETSISKVNLGQKAEILLDAYPKNILKGKAVHRGFDARTVNNVTSYIVDVLPEESPETMLSGMTANVKFILSEIPDAITIPNEALSSVDGKACVRIRGTELPEQTPCTPVKAGGSNETSTLILEGLKTDQTLWVQDLKPLEAKGASLPRNPFSPMGGGRTRH
ncbi:MAG: efflux RND transporter periplasmic adaptor subunit [Bdellovibrionales bacterium]|nr:efflux RND transporter periplasmic adaptor subunit [Bdellovibrionales bacterium]